MSLKDLKRLRGVQCIQCIQWFSDPVCQTTTWPTTPNALKYDYNARYYDSTLGRFISPDSIVPDFSNPQDLNRYSYVRNNPVRFTDPTGHYTFEEEPDDPFNYYHNLGNDEDIRAAQPVEDVSAYEPVTVGEILIPAAALYGIAVFGSVAQAVGFDALMFAEPQFYYYATKAYQASKTGAGWLVSKALKGGAEACTFDCSPVNIATGAIEEVLFDVDFYVTPQGVSIPNKPKYQIPDNYVENPYRKANYGLIVDGKYSEMLRIDPPTPLGKKGPNYSHYHIQNENTHYGPRPELEDPGFPN